MAEWTPLELEKIISGVSCDICQKKFSLRKSLVIHLKKVHNLELTAKDPLKMYKCDVCAKAYKDHSNMLRHKNMAHRTLKVKPEASPLPKPYIFNLRDFESVDVVDSKMKEECLEIMQSIIHRAEESSEVAHGLKQFIKNHRTLRTDSAIACALRTYARCNETNAKGYRTVGLKRNIVHPIPPDKPKKTRVIHRNSRPEKSLTAEHQYSESLPEGQ